MSTSVVVGRVLLTTDQQLRMEELAVIACANLVDGRGVEINEDGTGDVFATASLCEDSIELARVVESFSIGVRTTILLETVLEQVPAIGVNFGCYVYVNRRDLQLPRAVSELCTGLADVEVKNLRSQGNQRSVLMRRVFIDWEIDVYLSSSHDERVMMVEFWRCEGMNWLSPARSSKILN